MKVQYVSNPEHPGQMVVQMQVPLRVAQVLGAMCSCTSNSEEEASELLDELQHLAMTIFDRLGESDYSVEGTIHLGTL